MLILRPLRFEQAKLHLGHRRSTPTILGISQPTSSGRQAGAKPWLPPDRTWPQAMRRRTLDASGGGEADDRSHPARAAPGTSTAL